MCILFQRYTRWLNERVQTQNSPIPRNQDVIRSKRIKHIFRKRTMSSKYCIYQYPTHNWQNDEINCINLFLSIRLMKCSNSKLHFVNVNVNVMNTHLSSNMVHQTLHARIHAERMLAWQQFGVAVPVQAHATSEQLLEMFHRLICILQT